MASFKYRIRLTSDAEPGTGLGGETQNELIPRDDADRPVVRASHVKGLMRAVFDELEEALGWDSRLNDRVFGAADTDDDRDAAFRLTDATVHGAVPSSRFVSRTAVGSSGVVVEKSLRSTESIPLGTVFEGRVLSQVREGTAQDLAWRLALLAIPAIGSSRNRGCGQCVVEIEQPTKNGDPVQEQRSPGALLSMLDEQLKTEGWTETPSQAAREEGRGHKLSDQSVVMRLTFEAETPICCPELADKTNVIRSAFSIPASAVQGAILHRLNAMNRALADELYMCGNFRAWPLHPCGHLDQSSDVLASIRVSLTHRVAKFSVGGQYLADDFQDEAIQPYEWTEVSKGAPLKASDGVLLCRANKPVQLWRASDMPHVISSHGVHNDRSANPDHPSGRNLFSVDAMAPLRWQGLVVLPEDAADALIDSLEQDSTVAVGKSRTVRGIGRLFAERLDGLPLQWQTPQGLDHTVLVVQSPLLCATQPDRNVSAERELQELFTGWAETHNLSLPQIKDNGVWASAGIRFGWNRTVDRGRLGACRVILPGSVVAFADRLNDDALAALAKGIGGGRKRGYGAVSVHPGKAVDLYKSEPEMPTVTGAANGQLKGAVELVLKMRGNTNWLPSPSQIRAVQQRLRNQETDEETCKQEVLRYIKRQTERTSRIWFTWEPIYRQMNELVKNYDPAVAFRALELLADLAADQRGEG